MMNNLYNSIRQGSLSIAYNINNCPVYNKDVLMTHACDSDFYSDSDVSENLEIVPRALSLVAPDTPHSLAPH